VRCPEAYHNNPRAWLAHLLDELTFGFTAMND
jgi:hypothetical protein